VKLKISWADVFVGALLLMEYRFFYILPLPQAIAKTNTYHNKLMELIWIFLFVLFVVKYRLQNYKYRNIVFAFLIIVTIDVVYTIVTYRNEPIQNILVPYIAYLTILLYFPLSEYFSTKLNRFSSMLAGMNIIACLIVTAQAFIYNKTGRLFLSIYEFERSEKIAVRDGEIRITYISTIVSIAMVFAICNLVILKRKIILNGISLLLGYIYFYYVAQTRMYVFLFALLLLFAFYFENDNKKKARALIVLLVTLVIVAGFFAFNVPEAIASLIRPLQDGSYQTNGSYYARLDAYVYYWDSILAHPLFGLGVMNADKTSPNYYVIHGTRGVAYYSDIGLFGSVAEFGIPILILFIYMMAKTFPAKDQMDIRMYRFKKIYWLFILLSCISLCVLDPQRIIVLSIGLALFNRDDNTDKEELVYQV
jgi:hypothetical protein